MTRTEHRGTERFVLIGLAQVKCAWFAEVARWSTSGSLAADFIKAVSANEVRTLLRSGRRFSALVLDGTMLGIDRDLLETASECGCAPIVVDPSARDWAAIGAAGTLPADFGPDALHALLCDVATPVTRADELPGPAPAEFDGEAHRARTVVVTGAGGTGRSTVAMALAQGFGGDVRHADTVVLADLALHADLAVLHDTGDVIPGIIELAEAHRGGVPTAETIRSLTFDVVAHRYRLLLGLRRHRDWTALRPRALRAGIDSLRRTFTLVIADADADVEGEAATGSADVEDRNLLARTAIDIADVVVVVGGAGVKGSHSLVRVVRDCLDAGVEPARIVPVVNHVRRSRQRRVEAVRTIVELLAASHPGTAVLSPVVLDDRRDLEPALRDGTGVPRAMVGPLTNAVRATMDGVPERRAALTAGEPEPVTPGSLGIWADEETA